MPTVIISLKVQPGREEEFRRLQAEVTELVKLQPGFAGVDLIPPVAGLQIEWVVVFRFNSDQSLRTWLDCDERLMIIEKLSQTLMEPPAMQILADGDQTGGSVSVVFSQHIREGGQEDFLRWHEELLAAQSQWPGYLGTESFPQTPGIQEEWVDIVRFENVESLEGWLASDARRTLMQRRADFAEKISERRIASGLEAWFSSGRRPLRLPPPRWKQAFAVLLALYPTSTLLNFVLIPFISHWPMPLRMLLTNTLGVALLTFVVMPFTSKFLGDWLTSSTHAGAKDLLGAFLVILILVVLAAVFLFLI